jgi:hypothetical protein
MEAIEPIASSAIVSERTEGIAIKNFGEIGGCVPILQRGGSYCIRLWSA